MSTDNESVKKTLLVTVLLCLVCSIIVSGAAVLLKPVQEKNQRISKQRNILAIAGVLDPNRSITHQFKKFTPALVDLRTGTFSDAFNPDTYDAQKAAKNPNRSQAINAQEDLARIRRRPDFAVVYLVKRDNSISTNAIGTNAIDTIVLPVYGQGLWSTMYGYIALKGDLKTVAGFGFYQQGETPGLGGEVDNPKWRALWPGKQVYDKHDRVIIQVIKGKISPDSEQYQHTVDGLAGASLTTKGVDHLLKYWMGKSGFEPFLKHLKAGTAGEL